jgi:hypothetical protein
MWGTFNVVMRIVREGIEAAQSAMHYVAPVGEKDQYISRIMQNITPFLHATFAAA